MDRSKEGDAQIHTPETVCACGCSTDLLLTYTYLQLHTQCYSRVSLTFLPLGYACGVQPLCQNISTQLGKEYTTPQPDCARSITCTDTDIHKVHLKPHNTNSDTHQCCLPLEMCLSEDKKNIYKRLENKLNLLLLYVYFPTLREQRAAGRLRVAAYKLYYVLLYTLCSVCAYC